MTRNNNLMSRIESKFTNLGLSTDVTLPLDQDSPALEDLYDGFTEEDNDKTLVEDPPAFCSTQRNRIRSASPSSTSSLGVTSDPFELQTSVRGQKGVEFHQKSDGHGPIHVTHVYNPKKRVFRTKKKKKKISQNTFHAI